MTNGRTVRVTKRPLVASGITLSVVFILLVLSLVIVLNPTLGWFSQVSEVSGNDNEMKSDVENAHAEYECYVYNIRTSSVDVQDLDDLNMQPYDMIFDVRNRYTPAIVRVELTHIKPAFATSGTLDITLYRDTTKANDVLNDYFSSIMRITAVVGNSYYSSDPDTLYSNIDTALYTTVKAYAQNYSSDSSKTFTTVTGGTGTDGDPFTYSKANSITLSVPYTSSDKNGDALNLYLYITYDESLVHKYRAAEGIDTSSSTVGKTVTMTSDGEKMIISVS